MTNEIAIRVENVAKKYCRELKHTMRYGMCDIARNALGRSCRPDKLRAGEFWALDGVSVEVKKGETLGVIGANGSGKTTLLKLLNGILLPDRGRIEVNGRVGALIEVGAGFHPLLTGRENVYVNGAILGMGSREIDAKFDDIVAFADIGDFIDAPVKHYSSGMYVRLGFAVAVHCDPDLLLVDEVLSVGDWGFQMRCVRKVKEAQERGVTTIIVSHALDTIVGFCGEALYLKGGRVQARGPSSTVVSAYRNDVKMMQLALREGANRTSARTDVEMANIEILDAAGNPSDQFRTGEALVLRVSFVAHRRVERPVFGVATFAADGTYVYACNTLYDGIAVPPLDGPGSFEYRLPRLPLLAGTYVLTVGILEESLAAFYDVWDRACHFRVTTDCLDHGIVHLDHEWDLQNLTSGERRAEQ